MFGLSGSAGGVGTSLRFTRTLRAPFTQRSPIRRDGRAAPRD